MTYNLSQLQAELAAANITVPALGMTTRDGVITIHTYNENGEIVPLPPEAQPIIDAYVPPEPPTKIDLGNDVPTDQEDRLADAVVYLRHYLNLDSPSAVQSTAALKLLIRIVLYLLKHRLGY